MDASEINRSLVSELESMGFSEAQATKALCSSGNSSLEAAVNWIIDHENDAETDEMPVVTIDIIETPSPTFDSEQVKLKAQELRERVRKRREEEDKKLEKEREKARIRAGKELLATKRMAQENERKRFEAQRKIEKEEERRARERIRQKLQQDKEERRVSLGSSMNSSTSSKSIKTSKQETKNHLEVDFSASSGNVPTEKEVLRECLRSLRRQHKEEDAKVQRAFKSLLVYVRNIISNPDEPKFRKIRLSNPAFQARVGIFKEGLQFLELCGFERVRGGDFLVLRRDKIDMAVLRSAGMVLNSAITNPFFGLLSK
ncbi:uncharacterized protein LOC132610914 [Lycium barbarum]|uniref:uncharacterized protein LOC132610914 n=1 Tax=Lycium barbarum TaxID=112863 RepID=UPI00293E8BC8|nr:uncharacterized protein LOC132610914 [Lycium barbarum]XP_060181308.1 uncharacterized protein LOC132610914 [Lycium barbarum]